MKFAVPYFKKNGGKWMDAADEVIIKYENNGELALVNFIKEHPNQRIIIDIINFDDFSHNKLNPAIFRGLKTEHYLKNWALRFNHNVPEVEGYLKDSGLLTFDLYMPEIDYFYKMPVETFEQLDRFLYTSASDVYITNALAFDLKRVKEKINKAEFPPKIRIYPNVCQAYWKDITSIKSFFVRPEDVKLYEPYVDIMEIYAETLLQLTSADVYFDIYHNSGTWYGDLKEYLIGCNCSIYNPYVFTDFGERRLRCQKKCVINGSCNFCDSQLEYMELMNKTMDKMGKIEETEADVEDEDIRIYIGEELIDNT